MVYHHPIPSRFVSYVFTHGSEQRIAAVASLGKLVQGGRHVHRVQFLDDWVCLDPWSLGNNTAGK